MTRVVLAALAASIVTLARAQDPAAESAGPAVAVPATARTAGSDGVWSASVRIGSYVPVMGQFNVYRPGFAVEAGLGRRFARYLSLELSGLVTKVSTSIPVATSVWLGDGIATESDTEMAGVLATLRATWASGPVELFAGAGTGYYWVEQHEEVKGPYVSGGFGSHDHPWGAHAVAGTILRITPALHVSGEVRYTYLEPKLFEHWQRADGLGIALGIGFRF